MNFKNGDVVTSSRWDEPVEINLVEERGGYIRIIGSTVRTRQHIDDLIPSGELETISLVKLESDFSAKPEDVFLSLETKRYRYASLYDPLLAMNTSKIDPLPHQIEAVYGYILRLPRIRFLIADDPGAGKTIMAGLIIKELKLRKLVERVLIVVPGHLKDQWRREMKDRFDEKFTVVYRGLLEAFYGENVWQRENQIITSMDYAKREEVLPSLSSTHFDLIIVDESHKMTAYKYGESITRTIRYKLGEVLSRISEHLLFLTATPHKGDPENFRLFLDLLEPGFFATNEMLAESIQGKDNPLFIRRVKEDLNDFEGKPLFLPRYVKTVAFEMGVESPKEKVLYNELSKYVHDVYNKALSKDKKRNITFALVILQRRFSSSTYALLKSLERRKAKLSALMSEAIKEKKIDERTFDFEVIEDLSEEERWKQEELWETLSVAENREELEKEIRLLGQLIEKAEEIINAGNEIKLRQLKTTLTNLNERFSDEKILIFTESKDTLDYLELRMKKWGYSVNTIHGGMKMEDRVKAESIFKNETQVMVATEAAGEGINLQFCRLMINYDIPWNPNRLEQRMGRIHRYGQRKEVYVFNLVISDTREGMVLQKLFAKLEEIKKALGSDKVFDVLSEVLYGTNLAQLLLDAAANARSIEEILKEIDITVDEEYITKVKDNLGESLATHFIDYTRIKEMADRAREYRLIPEYTEAYFLKAFDKVGGKYKQRKDGFYSIESVPYDLRKISEEESFKKSYDSILRSYPKITFDKEQAFENPDTEFICFGHPLFESMMAWVERKLASSLQSGAVFKDPDGELDGTVIFFDGEVKDGKNTMAGKRLFSYYVSKDMKELTFLNPAFIWDLKEGDNETVDPVNIDAVKSKAMEALIPKIEDYRNELSKERERQARIKEKYGIKSLDYLIIRLDGDLIELIDRKNKGEKVDLVIRNKQDRKKKYEDALQELKHTIEHERMLTMSTPSFIGAIRVIPETDIHPAMKSNKEIERIGMEVSMEYERKQGRIPEDVSAENLGFDIRSTDKDGNKRYIEVKARASVGDISITQNEWFKASRFGSDYYLYVVFNASSNPQLYVVENPAENIEPEKKVELVRFIVKSDQVTDVGHTV